VSASTCRTLWCISVVLPWILSSVALKAQEPPPFPSIYALRFDGSDDYVVVPDSESLKPREALTIEAWIKSETTQGARVIVSKWGPGYGPGYIFKDHNWTDGLRLQVILAEGGEADVAGETPIALNRWIHVAATFDSAHARLYYNGELDGEVAGGLAIKNGPIHLLIGSVYDGREVFKGLIDEVRIWNYARSQEEIQATMHRALRGDEPGLVAYWRFNEAPGDQRVLDYSPYGNHGTLGATDSPDPQDPERVYTGGVSPIQVAIDEAAPGSTIVIPPGTYKLAEPLNFRGKGIAVRSEAGPELTRIELETPSDVLGAVVVFSGLEGRGTVFEGFTVSGGPVGVLCNGTSPTLRNLHVVDNDCGVECRSGAMPLLKDCKLERNGPSEGGGALRCTSSSPVLVRCSILNNRGEAPGGGAVFCKSGSRPTFIDCRIEQNGFWTAEEGYGGGICCVESSVVLSNCTVSFNWVRDDFDGGTVEGAGIYLWTAAALIEGCTIRGNWGTSIKAGGIYCGGGTRAEIIDCRIEGNQAAGVFVEDAHVLISWSVLAANRRTGITLVRSDGEILNCTVADTFGVGIRLEDSALLLRNSIVWGNDAGGLEVSGTSEPALWYCCLQGEEPSAERGIINQDPRFCSWGDRGEVYVDAGFAGTGDGSRNAPYTSLGPALQFSYDLREDSPCLAASEDGLPIGARPIGCTAQVAENRLVHLSSGTYRIFGYTLRHKVSLIGQGPEATIVLGSVFGLETGGQLALLTVTGGRNGGIVIESGGSPGIRNCVVEKNYWGDWLGNFGPGLYCGPGSAPQVINCVFRDNEAYYMRGAGIYCGNNSSGLFQNCIIEGNDSDGDGGGIFCESRAQPVFRNCVITRNGGMPPGCGVYLSAESSPVFINCTIADNPWGAGIWWEEGSSPALTNCIVWGNGTAPPPGGLIKYSCIEGEAVRPGPGNLNADPLFVKSASDQGDPSGGWDYHLRPDSPCIDAGTSEGVAPTDIEGNPRACSQAVDIGAYESCPEIPPAFLRGDANSDTQVDLSDPLFTLRYLFSLGPNPLCFDAADPTDDGKIDLQDVLSLLTFLFAGGMPPGSPYPNCGPDPTPDALPCVQSPCQ